MQTEQQNAPRVRVEIADQSGHTDMELTQAEAVDVVERNSGTHWVFSGGRLVQAAELANADWAEMAENNTTVQLVPQLAGGQ